MRGKAAKNNRAALRSPVVATLCLQNPSHLASPPHHALRYSLIMRGGFIEIPAACPTREMVAAPPSAHLMEWGGIRCPLLLSPRLLSRPPHCTPHLSQQHKVEQQVYGHPRQQESVLWGGGGGGG